MTDDELAKKRDAERIAAGLAVLEDEVRRERPATLHEIRVLEGAITRATGRVYLIDWTKLDISEVREVQRLVRDLENDKTAAVGRARREPWRRP